MGGRKVKKKKTKDDLFTASRKEEELRKRIKCRLKKYVDREKKNEA